MKGFKDSVKVATPINHNSDLSHQINTSFDFFQFRPVLCEEMYPSDTFKVHISDYFRAKPLAGAVYANMYKKYSCFFVPYRILWNRWSDFLTGGSSGKLEFNVPYVTLSDFVNIACNLFSAYDAASGNTRNNLGAVYRNMLDYWSDLGIDISLFYGQDDSTQFNAQNLAKMRIPLLRPLACRHIWFDWFRDQNLIGDDVRDSYCPVGFPESGIVPQSDVTSYYSSFQPALNTLLSPLPVCVEKDYFTTMMREPQRGGTPFIPVQLPSVDLNGGFNNTTAGGSSGANVRVGGNKLGKINSQGNVDVASTDIIGMFDYNAVRIAKGLAKYLEKNNISGGSDLQQLLAHWGTAPNPLVFNRSVYIGSFVDHMRIDEVVSPVDTEYSRAGEVGTKINMNGNGYFEYTANEHGFFVVVLTARPENTYKGGIRREVLHGCLGNGRFDFYTPELEKTGFQPAYNYEKMTECFRADGEADPFASCGYVPRYAENKRQFNRYTGQMQTHLFDDLRVVRDFSAAQYSDNDLFINTDFTMIYGYPVTYRYDRFFEMERPDYDHFDGWIKFDIDVSSPRNEYAAPLIQNSDGDDIRLPYAGVRM